MVFLKTIWSSPTRLWKKWLVIARVIGNFQAQVILSLFYLVLFLPLGVVFRFFADPLRMRKVSGSNFQKWEHSKESLEQARKQY